MTGSPVLYSVLR